MTIIVGFAVGAMFLMYGVERLFSKGFFKGIKRSFVLAFSVVGAIGIGGYLYLNNAVNDIPKFEEEALTTTPTVNTPPTATEAAPIEIPVPSGLQTMLIWSVGSAGLTEEDAADIGVNLEGREEDGLADVVMLFVRLDDKSAIISFPRDTWIEEYEAKLSEIPNQHSVGTMREIIELRSGIEIDQMASINFQSFVEMVDLVGGIYIDVENPIRSDSTGLNLDSGLQYMDGETALKYVRSRKGEEFIDGEWVSLTGSDVDRIVRQQEVVNLLVEQVDAQKAASHVTEIIDITQRNVVTTEGVDISYLLGWLSARDANTFAVEGVFDTINQKSVLVVSPENSRSQIQEFLAEVFELEIDVENTFDE